MRIAFTGLISQSYSPEHAKIIAICEGVKFAKRFGYSGFIIESDCKGVINNFSPVLRALSHLGHIHGQLFTLIDRLQVLLSFTRCSVNVSTHLFPAKVLSNCPSNI